MDTKINISLRMGVSNLFKAVQAVGQGQEGFE
jgi:hypothetical protein